MIANPHLVGETEAELASRARCFLRSMRAMGYVALNLGPHELAVGEAALRKAAKVHRIALLSANIMREESGKPAFKTSLIRKVAGLKIGLFGLVTESPPNYGKLFVKRGLRVIEPVKAARRAVRELRRRGCDLVIALSQLKRHEIEDLGDQIKGLDIVLGSSGMELTQSLQRLGKVLYGDTYTKGKYIAQLLIDPGEPGRGWQVENLEQSMASERATLAQQVQSLKAELDSASGPDSPLQLTKESRKIMRARLVRARASLQRLGLELEGGAVKQEGAGQLALSMHPLGSDIADNAKVLAYVKAHKKKYPAKAQRH
jgi:hypothetical protein